MLEINKIHLGDCLELMKLIPDGSIDAIITDPPYGTTACKWDTVIPFDLMWEQLKRVIKPNGAIVLFGSEPFSSALRMSNIKQYKYDWIWDKVTAKGHLVVKYRPMQQTEVISVFSKEKHNYYPIMIDRPKSKIQFTKEAKRTDIMGGKENMKDKRIYDTWFPKTLLQFKTERGLHPTQKPVALIEYLIRTYTNEGETVLDFTIGSGTTAIACINTNRNYIGFELDKGYFDIANKRLSEIVEKK